MQSEPETVSAGPTSTYDVIVIGGGMAGVSMAYELARDRRVVLLEAERTLAYHSTGRSAAMFLETYGGHDVRALTVGSRAFLEDPPEGFDRPLLTLRPLLQFSRPGRERRIRELYEQVSPVVPQARLLDAAQAQACSPLLRPGTVGAGLLEPDAMEIDVHALHSGFVRGARANGASVVTGCRVMSAELIAGRWRVETTDGRQYEAERVVDAAGAWADDVAASAGCARVGLEPRRRSVFMIGAEEADGADGGDLASVGGIAGGGQVVAGPTDAAGAGPGNDVEEGATVVAAGRQVAPMIYNVDETFYVKPEGDQYLCSPADRTPCAPGDAKADVEQIARALDEIREVTVLRARSVRTTWAGLRTFGPDGNLVIGYDPARPGFFWFAGQGGYGIQTAPAAARLGRALIDSEPAPDDLVALGLDLARLAPGRPVPA